jgi:hypothetical protein
MSPSISTLHKEEDYLDKNAALDVVSCEAKPKYPGPNVMPAM